MTFKTKIALITATILWASAFVGIRAGLQGYSPEGLALFRFLIASLCMSIVYFRMPSRTPMPLKDVCALMGVGVIGIGVYNIALNYGELTISSGASSFITGQAPIVTMLFATMFLGERISLFHLSGFIVSFFGVALIATGVSSRAAFSAGTSALSSNSGIVYILLATLISGLFSALQKPFLRRYHPLETTTYIIWGATLFLSLYASQLQKDLLHATVSSTLMVIYLGIFPAAIAYFAWSYALARVPVSRAVSFIYFMPFISTLMGWLYLGEVPVLLSLIGGLVAIAGVWIVNQSYQTNPVPEGAS